MPLFVRQSFETSSSFLWCPCLLWSPLRSHRPTHWCGPGKATGSFPTAPQTSMASWRFRTSSLRMRASTFARVPICLPWMKVVPPSTCQVCDPSAWHSTSHHPHPCFCTPALTPIVSLTNITPLSSAWNDACTAVLECFVIVWHQCWLLG